MYINTVRTGSVIITLGKYISRWELVFHNGVKQTDLVKIDDVLRYLYGIITMVPFERFIRGGSIWRGYRALILFILFFNFHIIYCGGRFNNGYIDKKFSSEYIDDNGTGVKQKNSHRHTE